ncbi:hypothetical protein ACC732_37245, partial [Rhizobium ruizarguesonis]
FGDTFITLHSISGDGYSYPELKKFAIQARDMLLTTPGVEKAVIIGDQNAVVAVETVLALVGPEAGGEGAEREQQHDD